MPNASNVTDESPKRIFLIGDTGSGKTTQFLTLPGRKYIHLFDSNALSSLAGHDLDYDEYLPDPVSAAVASLKKEGKSDIRSGGGSDSYHRFEMEFDKRLAGGFFDPYDWIGFDSATTLLDLIMDRVLTLNGRFGQWPHEDDYGPQMMAFINLCRTITGMGKGLFMTGHLEEKQDRVTKKLTNRPMMTGRLAIKIPLLFSEVWPCESELDTKQERMNYFIQTARSGNMMVARTSIKGLNPVENVTIDWSKPVMGQGIGGILNWAKRQADTAK